MRITVVAVGRMKERHFREAAEEYAKRLGPYADLRVTEVSDRDVSRDEGRALRDEAADVARAVPESAHVIAMDAAGPEMTSEEFAAWLERSMLEGRAHLCFIVGGAAGHGAEALALADERLSLGKMTLPHQLARVVLLEQLYRAFRIIRKEPYHR